jgi:hypothetical protein
MTGVWGRTPLCHFVTSPPQGGRGAFPDACRIPLSPHVGEMPGRAEGGNPPAAAHRILPTAYHGGPA